MDKIIKKARELADSINGSIQLKLLKELQTRIEENPSLKNKITEFKKMSVMFETKKAQGLLPDFEEEKQIGRLYAEIILHDEAKRYIDVENSLFDTLNTVHEILESTEFSAIQTSHIN